LLDASRIAFFVESRNNGDRFKHWFDTFLLWLPPSGLLGAHRFFTGSQGIGFVWMFTLGNAGFGWILDAFRLSKLTSECNAADVSTDKEFHHLHRTTADSYALWLPPVGLFGAHRYYLGYYRSAILYTFTVSLFTFGWFADLWLIPCMLAEHRKSRPHYYFRQLMPLGLPSPDSTDGNSSNQNSDVYSLNDSDENDNYVPTSESQTFQPQQFLVQQVPPPRFAQFPVHPQLNGDTVHPASLWVPAFGQFYYPQQQYVVVASSAGEDEEEEQRSLSDDNSIDVDLLSS